MHPNWDYEEFDDAIGRAALLLRSRRPHCRLDRRRHLGGKRFGDLSRRRRLVGRPSRRGSRHPVGLRPRSSARLALLQRSPHRLTNRPAQPRPLRLGCSGKSLRFEKFRHRHAKRRWLASGCWKPPRPGVARQPGGVRCTGCGAVEYRGTEPLDELPHCTRCGSLLRPGVVWFEEPLPEAVWQEAHRAVRECDCLLVVGTSAVVYPAAGLIDFAPRVIEVNLDRTAASRRRHRGPLRSPPGKFCRGWYKEWKTEDN